MMKLEEWKKDAESGRDCSLFGAFPSDRTIEFRLKADFEPDTVSMVIHADGLDGGKIEWLTFPLIREQNDFCLVLDFNRLLNDGHLADRGLFYYYYAVRCDGQELVFGGENPLELDILKDYVGERQLLLFSPDYHTSEGFADGMAYQIFVDRFFRSGRSPVKDGAVLDTDWENGIPEYGTAPGAPVENNTFFGGDLYGIEMKLGYLESLGVKTIYLTPVFDAYSNHKYDVGDYLKVDEMFGGDEALAALCRSASERGIRVMLDGVFNHTGADSVYFNRNGRYPQKGAAQTPESAYYEWYNFRSYPDDYECWWGVRILPRVRSGLESYRKFICGSVVKKWMDAGVSGWRLDVADELAEPFLEDFRKAVHEENGDAVIIGEVWEDASDKISYGNRRHYFSGKQLDSVMNYPLRSALIEYIRFGDTESLRHATEGLYRRYPKQSSDNLLNFLGTHDTERIATVFGDTDPSVMTNQELAVLKMSQPEREKALQRVRLAYGILFGLPGVPCVYYGDEAGMEGGHDPFCRKPFPWHQADEGLLETIRTFGRLRKELQVFRHGLFRILCLTENAFVYCREPWNGEGDSVLIAAVRNGTLKLEFPVPAEDLLEGKPVTAADISAGSYGYYRFRDQAVSVVIDG